MSKKNNVVKLDQIRQKIEQIKEQGQKQYKPKYGRQIAKLEKEFKKIA